MRSGVVPTLTLWNDAGITPTIVKTRSPVVNVRPMADGLAAEPTLPVAIADDGRRRR